MHPHNTFHFRPVKRKRSQHSPETPPCPAARARLPLPSPQLPRLHLLPRHRQALQLNIHRLEDALVPQQLRDLGRRAARAPLARCGEGEGGKVAATPLRDRSMHGFEARAHDDEAGGYDADVHFDDGDG